MSQPRFDVLREPWIPVLRVDGATAELGIMGCLEQAHILSEIKDPSPIVEFGLYRLLVAFVLDALILAGRRPESVHDLRDLIAEGSFDNQILSDYAQACGDVFDLFHPERPFLQTAMPEEKAKPLAGMFPAMPSGTNVNHWHHVPEHEWTVSAAEAARLLTTIAPFMTAGGAGLSPSINGSPGVYVLPLGRNLFETLVVNLPLRLEQDAGDGAIAWRRRDLPGQERSQANTVEALTWRPRRIQLLVNVAADGALRVRQMRFGKGDSTRLTWIDTNLAYRYSDDRVTQIRMHEDRPLWRDAGPLLLVDETDHGKGDLRVSFKRPDAVGNAFAVNVDDVPARIQAYGMRTDLKMKVFEWAKAAWTVPPGLGRSTRLGSLVHREIDRAEGAARALRSAIKAVYPREGAGVKEALGALSARSERAFWQRLESRFVPLMKAFATLNPNAADDPALIESVAQDWRGAVHTLAWEQFESAVKDMDADSDALKRAVRARDRFGANLRKVLS
jgi:CRISPR system Cascade subunit CasA